MKPPLVGAVVVFSGLVFMAWSSVGGHTMSEPAASIAALWQAPRDLSGRDLFNGAWSAAHAPDPDAVYTYVRPKTGGANPGVIVRDPRGRIWHVKQPRASHGAEGPVEVTLSRVLSAIGYHQPPVYFLESFRMADDAGTHRVPGGRFRVDDESWKHIGSWSWHRNPFAGSRPAQGLLAILLLFNSWDLKDTNNALYDVRQGDRVERRYVVRDLGGALGQTGRYFVQRNNIDKYERHRYTTGVRNGFVQFVYRGHQSALIHDRITVDDLAWAADLLGGLSDRQWQDAFRAGGYDPAVAERFITKIHANLAEARQRVADWHAAAVDRRQ